MTREEAIVYFESLLKRFEEMHETETSYWGKVHTETTIEAIRTALSALRPVSRERVEKFKEYFDDLYGKGLEVYGWHLNGEPKPFDDFYEDACKYAGL